MKLITRLDYSPLRLQGALVLEHGDFGAGEPECMRKYEPKDKPSMHDSFFAVEYRWEK